MAPFNIEVLCLRPGLTVSRMSGIATPTFICPLARYQPHHPHLITAAATAATAAAAAAAACYLLYQDCPILIKLAPFPLILITISPTAFHPPCTP